MTPNRSLFCLKNCIRGGLLYSLFLVQFFFIGRVFTQIYPPAEGVELPEGYFERLQIDPTAFEFEGAWIHLVKQIRANREAYLRNEIILPEAQSRGGIRMSGTKYVPVLTGKFANTGADPYPASDLQTELFDGPWPTGTMTQYYSEISYGDMNLTGTVTSWVAVSHNDTYYEGGSNGLGTGAKTGEFLKEVLDLNDAALDFGQFDNDGPDGIPNSGDDDGYADFVAFVHPESGGECGNSNIWSHRWVYSGWWGTNYLTDDQSANGGFIRVRDYVIQPAFACDNTTMIQIGVFCHEFGHAFGLPDLYDTDGTSEGIGHWGLMASGSWNSPSKPAHMSPWCKEELGWVIPAVITPPSPNVDPRQFPGEIEALQSLPNVEFNAEVKKVWATGSPGNEYFLIENRQNTGFDVNLHASGLVIWHIDNAKTNNQQEWYPPLNPANHYMVAVEQADATWDLEHYNNRGDSGDPFRSTNFDCNTTPNTHSYTSGPSNIAFSNISASGDPMTFDLVFCGPPPEISISPTSFTVTLVPGQTTMEILTISNDGGSDLIFSLGEIPGTGPALEVRLASDGYVEGLRKYSPIPALPAGHSINQTTIDENAPVLKSMVIEYDRPTKSLFGFLPVESAGFADSILYDTYPSANTSIGFGNPVPFYAATKFTTSSAFNLTHVRTRYRTETSTAGIEVLVYSDNSGVPGSVLHSQTFTGSQYLGSNPHMVLFELSQTLPFGAGENFWIAMHYADVPYPQNTTTTGNNTAGRMYYSGSGITWSNLHTSFPGYAWVIRALSAGDIQWLELNPAAGVVSGSSSQDVDVSFDATGLATGTYTGEIRIFSNDFDEPVINVPLTLNVENPLSVNSKIFLEGPYNSAAGTMDTYLRDNGLLPTSQPFNISPWNYNGTESVGSIPAGVVDWVLLQLQEIPGGSVLSTEAAFVKDNGVIVDLDGSSPVGFLYPPGSYYVVVHHRNHLTIMSANPLVLSESSALYDFTTGQSQAYGTDPMKLLDAGVYGMIAGDGNSDGSITGADRESVWSLQNGTEWDYTDFGDFNLDGGVDATDLNLYWRENENSSTQVPEAVTTIVSRRGRKRQAK